MTTQRIVTGAHYGLRDWLAQRITAVVLVVFTLWLLAELLLMPTLSFGNWVGLFGTVHMKVLTLLALLALAWHAWIGVRDILMDYIKPTWIRLLLQVATIIALLGYVAWAVTILWRA